MSKPTDWQQREMGRDPQRSFIVQAPAGSGKTELLTQRMLALLARVEHPEEVVAITFTRKAAAQMSHRLLKYLRVAANKIDPQALPQHEQLSLDLALEVLKNDTEKGWNLLEQPSRLRIRTIDGLCSELAGQLPILSGLGGGQQIAVNAETLYRVAATRTLSVIEDDDDDLQADIVQVLDRYDNQYDRMVDLLTGMLANREQWLGHLLTSQSGDGFDRHGIEDALRILVEQQLQKAKEITPVKLFDELPRFFNYALANSPLDKTALYALIMAGGGPDSDTLDLPTHAQALPHWQTMIARFLTADGKKWRAGGDAKAGFPAPSKAKAADRASVKAWKDEYKTLIDEHRDNEELRMLFDTVRSLPQPEYQDEAWESLESLMRILLRAAAEWKLVMVETGEVDFSEVSVRAIESLGTADIPSDLALRVDYRIQHLLVDEFQDTSSNQIHLLDRLTAGWSDGDGRSLFLVGDPMQSIYRFRKAEVSLFIESWKGRLFSQIRLQRLRLSVNFRSTKPIVDWVNRAFPLVMPDQNDPVLGAVRYSAAGTRPGVTNHGEVLIQVLPERDDEEEARRVIDVISKCGMDESIAVLVRSRSHATEILAALDKLKQRESRFRYKAIDFTPLAETTVIRDLVSLTLALLQPADRLAWLALLRTPFIGMDLADLDELVDGDAGNIILDAIMEAANGKLSVLGVDGHQRLQRSGPLLLAGVNLRGRQTVRSVVESTWVSLGGPACVENSSELDDSATYFDLLDALQAENLPIDRDTLDQRMAKLHAQPDADATGGLQVLTIYAAKGLQFDTVILPALNRATAGDKPRLLHWFELADEDKIVLSPMRNNAEKEQQKKSGDLIKFINNIEKARQRLENGRLLYVASTRAVHSLHLFAAIKPGAKGEIKPQSSTLMAALWPAIEAEHTPLITLAAEHLQQARANQADVDGDEDSTPLNLIQDYRRLASDWQLPALPASVEVKAMDAMESQEYVEFSWAGEDARLAGNLVHRLLQLIGDHGVDRWETNGGTAYYAHWCHLQLASEGVRETKAASITEAVLSAIESCLASRQGQWILQDHDDAHCEYAITAVLDKQARNLVLDRTFVADDTRWIIDYKTSSHGGGDLEGFLKNESKRYRDQLRRYKQAMAITETRPIRTALYFPLFDRLVET